MARDGLSSLLCAGLLLGALSPLAAAGDSHTEYARGLAVQVALNQGRKHILDGNYEAAIKVLESQIAHIDGSGEYLIALRDAYRGAINQLRRAGRPTETALIEIYSRRLAILEQGPPLEPDAKQPAHSAPAAPAAPITPAATFEQPPKVRAKSETNPAPSCPAVGEDIGGDPFDTANNKRLAEARALLDRADAEFRGERYAKASELYARAHEAVPDVTRESSDRWAYCRLHAVVLRLNQRNRPTAKSELDNLEQEVRTAMGMTPKLKDFGEKLLGTIQVRRTTDEAPAKAAPAPAAATAPAAPAIKVRHGQAPGTGWATAETANFRIFHNQTAEYAERLAKIAETTRATVQRQWFGKVSEDWNPRCDIYLYATTDAYSQAAKVRPDSPGNTTYVRKGSTVVSRRIDLHVDDPNVLSNVLPHETTHAVLVGRFGPFDLPRWADEGLATLAEPSDSVARWLRNAQQYRQSGQTFSAQQLLQLPDWPEDRLLIAFYAQSVSLVDYLCKQKGRDVFVRFLSDSLRSGDVAALKKHYGFQSYQDLDLHWRADAFGETDSGYAQ